MRKSVAAFGLLFVLAVGLRGADSDGVSQFWEIFGVDWKPVKGLRFDLEKQIRYESTFTNIESDITEVGVRYGLTKWLDIQADYRFVNMGTEKRNRLDGNVIVGWHWGSVSISNRVRLQKEFIETTSAKDSELVFRDRLRVTLRRNKALRPFAGGEIFLGLGEDGREQNKYRLTAGLEYSVTKKVTLSAFYHFQRDLSEATNETTHIFACAFHYSFQSF